MAYPRPKTNTVSNSRVQYRTLGTQVIWDDRARRLALITGIENVEHARLMARKARKWGLNKLT